MTSTGILRIGRGLLPRGCGSSRLLRSSSVYSVPTTTASPPPPAPRAATVPVSWDDVVRTISADEKKKPLLNLGRVASAASVTTANKPAIVRTESEVRRRPQHQVVKEQVSRPLNMAEGMIKSTRVQLAGGDLRLGEFMEEVKTELWQYNAMPFRKRFRVQSLLRRLQTPAFEMWSDSLVRATASCPRAFTRTLLARHEASPSLPSLEAPGFDLLLLCWRPGAASTIHDHPKSGCWVKVLQGELKETRYSIARDDTDKHDAIVSCNNTVNSKTSSSSSSSSSRRGKVSLNGDDDAHSNGRPKNDDSSQRGERKLVENSASVYGAGTVSYMEDSMGYHKMENPSLTEECISLHLYSPGITECTTWADTSMSTNGVKASVDLDGSFFGKAARGGIERFGPRV